ncbi:uncharacterized protein [Phaseolus vulgaris]|uniref:uncharacterized protein n=1 Tax=Phaseolus vulgaris TaxID=3885 RepID=UPI0035CA73A1
MFWIKECLKSSSISILVNGSPSKEFKPTRGLRQGDPIAPFLFLIVVQGLLGLMNQTAIKELLSELKVIAKKVEVKLLPFANDTLILCELNIQNIRFVKARLRLSEICSRLRINFFKSKIGALGVDRNVLEMFSEILNCSIMNILFVYLGLPIGGNSAKASF